MNRAEFERELLSGNFGLMEAMIREACLKGLALHGRGDISVEKWDNRPYTCPGAGGRYEVFLHGMRIATGMTGMTPGMIAVNPMFLSESILILRALGIDIEIQFGAIDTEFHLTHPNGWTQCLTESELYDSRGYCLDAKDIEKL